MADVTKTIAANINLFGMGPPTIWGNSVVPYTMVWGTTLWGQGSFQVIYRLAHAITNSLSPDTTIIKYAKHLISESISPDSSDVLYYYTRHTISETLAPTCDLGSETLRDGSGGWKYVFVSETTDAENRSFASYTCGTAQTTSFTCAAAASTTWTQV